MYFFNFYEKNDSINTNLEVIHHGNYNCCTNDYFNLSKHENFYSFEYCGTGSGYCEKNLVFFKDIAEIDINQEVVLSIQSSSEVGTIYLTSDYKIINDTIFVNYKDEIRKNKFKEYNLTFVYKNGNVVLLDRIDDLSFARLIRVYKEF
jgi:hypothetical protein